MKKIKKLLSFIFLLFVTLTFAESEIPHQIISENPAKEVTTVESKKLKEKAELDILVNKITPIEIEGVVTAGGKTVYEILKVDEEQNLLNRVKNKMRLNSNGEIEYFITENLSQILNENQKQPRGRSRRSVPKGIEYETIENKNMTILTVKTEQPVYIAKLRDGILENVFKSGYIEKSQPRISVAGTGIFEMKVGTNPTFERNDNNGGGTRGLNGFDITGGTAGLDDKFIPDATNKYYLGIYKWLDVQVWCSHKIQVSDSDLMLHRNNHNLGNDWFYFSPKWLSKGPGGEYYWFNNLIQVKQLYRWNSDADITTGADANVHELRTHYQVDSSTYFPGVYKYSSFFTIFYWDAGTTTTAEFPNIILVYRDIKNFTITPKDWSNYEVGQITNTIFTEALSDITGSENSLPKDWSYRITDDENNISDTDGLYIAISPGQAGEKLGKRKVRLKSDVGTEVEAWLEKDSTGVAILKYKVIKIGKAPVDVKFQVKHWAYRRHLYDDTITLKIPFALNEGNGDLIMDLANIGENVEYSMGSDAKSVEEEFWRNRANKDIKFIPLNFKGVFPNTEIMDLGKNIINNLDIKVNNGSIQNISGKEYRTPNYAIELIEGNGNLKITKLSNSEIDETISIDYKYNKLKLGNFTIRITNHKTKDIGNATFKIDARMKTLKTEAGDGKYDWYHQDGGVSYSLGNTKNNDYVNFFKVDYNPSNLESTNIIKLVSVEGRNTIKYEKVNANGYDYSLFSKNGSWIGETAIPVNFQLTDIKNRLVTSIKNENESDAQNKFIILSDNLKTYKGNIIEEFTTDTINEAKATLDFSNFDLNTQGVWEPEATGEAYSINGNGVKMSFSSGKLFDSKNEIINNKVVTKLVVTETNGTSIEKEVLNPNEEIVVGMKSNDFIIQSNGNLVITKKQRDYEKKEYKIEIYHKELKLGTLVVEILNDIPIEIGEYSFNIDKRLETKDENITHWLYGNKEASVRIGDAKKDFSELFNINNGFNNLKSKMISKVISVEERLVKVDTSDINGNKLTYFKINEGTNLDESAAIPYEVNLDKIGDILAISTYNDKLTDNIFIVETEDGIRYKGNIKENFVGIEAIKAEGKINFRKTGHIATWEPSSEGLAINGKTQIEFTSQDKKVFDTRGRIKTTTSIANKLKVKQIDGEVKELKGNIGENLIIKFDTGELFELDKDGNLTIRGCYEKTEKTFIIESYYNDILLGQLTVTLETGEAFIIEGEDTYDFGQMVGGQKYNLIGTFNIKNLGNLKVTGVSVPTNANMTHTTDTSQKIPLKLQSSTRVLGTNQDVDAIISLTALPAKEQAIGNYEGEFFITITIDESGN